MPKVEAPYNFQTLVDSYFKCYIVKYQIYLCFCFLWDFFIKLIFYFIKTSIEVNWETQYLQWNTRDQNEEKILILESKQNIISIVNLINQQACIFHLIFLMRCRSSQVLKINIQGHSWWLSGKESACQYRRLVWSLIQEDLTCCRATKLNSVLQLLNMCSRAEKTQLLSLPATTTEACVP